MNSVNRTPTHKPGSARKSIAGATLALIGVLCAVIVFAHTSTARSAPKPAPARVASRTPEARAAAIIALQGEFALLRTPAAVSPSAALRKAVAKAPASYGLDLAAARRASATGSWLVPGDGWLCIAAADSEGLGLACTNSESAEAGELSLVERSQAIGSERIVGACPDGTTSVLGADQCGLARGAVHESTYTVSVRGPAGMTSG